MLVDIFDGEAFSYTTTDLTFFANDFYMNWRWQKTFLKVISKVQTSFKHLFVMCTQLNIYNINIIVTKLCTKFQFYLGVLTETYNPSFVVNYASKSMVNPVDGMKFPRYHVILPTGHFNYCHFAYDGLPTLTFCLQLGWRLYCLPNQTQPTP